MSNWIKCSERLPLELNSEDIYKEVVVLVTDGVLVETCSFCTGSIGELWRDWGAYHTSFNVELITNWQPLPEPPEAE